RRAASVRKLDPLAQPCARVASPVRTPQRGSEIDERPRMLQLRRRLRQDCDRLAEQVLAAGAAFDQPERAEGNTDRPRRPPPARKLQLLDGERSRLRPPAELLQRERGLR